MRIKQKNPHFYYHSLRHTSGERVRVKSVIVTFNAISIARAHTLLQRTGFTVRDL